MSETNTKTAAKTAEVAAPNPMEPIRVIVRRPFGVTDSHQWFGFNDWGRQIQFDKPVNMPRAAVEYFRAAERPEFSVGENGGPVASYSAAYNIVDAPAE